MNPISFSVISLPRIKKLDPHGVGGVLWVHWGAVSAKLLPEPNYLKVVSYNPWFKNPLQCTVLHNVEITGTSKFLFFFF